jgi:hypothetical protein
MDWLPCLSTPMPHENSHALSAVPSGCADHTDIAPFAVECILCGGAHAGWQRKRRAMGNRATPIKSRTTAGHGQENIHEYKEEAITARGQLQAQRGLPQGNEKGGTSGPILPAGGTAASTQNPQCEGVREPGFPSFCHMPQHLLDPTAKRTSNRKKISDNQNRSQNQ